MNEKLIILDTDVGTDCDDVGALAMLNAFCDKKEAKLIACTHSNGLKYGAACIEIINNLYGRENIPIGVNNDCNFLSESNYDVYATNVATKEKMLHKTYDTYEKAVPVMRKALANSPDGAVTMVGVGQFCNFADLLNSPPCEHSPLTGIELIKKKVKELVLMGGFFKHDEREKYYGIENPGEYNICTHIVSAKTVVSKWPTPIVFSPFEIGYNIITNAPSSTKPSQDTAFVESYKPYGGERFSWDQTAVLYAVRGCCDYWDISNNGDVSIDEKGRTFFTENNKGIHRYLIEKKDPKIMSDIINELMVQGGTAT